MANENETKSKQRRCRHAHRCLGKNWQDTYCVADGWEEENLKIVDEETCEACEKFKSKYIEYPLTINGIKNRKMDFSGLGHKCGELCEIRPCAEEYEGKSYIGIYIGDLPISIYTTHDPKTGILTNDTMNNPAIFVPELKKIIYGCESWWRKIESVEDFKGISEEDVDNTWYVGLLKAMMKTESEE